MYIYTHNLPLQRNATACREGALLPMGKTMHVADSLTGGRGGDRDMGGVSLV